MTWTDKIPDFGAINWVGIGLLCINFVMLPFLFFSSDAPEYHDGDYPTVELLAGDHVLQAKMEDASHAMPEEAHKRQKMHEPQNSHGQPIENHDQHTTDTHEVTNEGHVEASHDGQESIDKNPSNLNQGDKSHEIIKATHTGDPLARVCYEVGPLKSDNEQIKLQNLVEIKGMFVSIKYARSNENLGYWVFIPPLRSRPLARLKVEELKLTGFNDVVLLSRNEPINAVSLGVFADQKNAYKHMLRAQSLGFNARMDIRYQSLGEMWLSVEVSEGKDLDDEGWGELIKDYPQVQVHPVKCS